MVLVVSADPQGMLVDFPPHSFRGLGPSHSQHAPHLCNSQGVWKLPGKLILPAPCSVLACRINKRP